MPRMDANDEFARKRILRRKRIIRRRIILGFGLFFVLLSAVFAVLSFTVLFPVKSVNAAGSKIYSQEEIVAACGINAGDNLLRADVDTEKIRKQLPYVQSVTVRRKLPDTVNITVKDAKENAVVGSGGKYYSVGRDWFVLNCYDEMPRDLIEIISEKIECKVGSFAKFSDAKTETLINDIEKNAGDCGIKLNEIDLTDELTVSVKAEGRFRVNMGTSNNLDKKFAHLGGMIKNIDPQKTGKINLSMWTPSNTEGTFVEGSAE